MKSKKINSLISLILYSIIVAFIFNLNSIERLTLLKTHYIGGGTDPISFIWFINWLPFAITHHLNIFHTNMIWSPSGVNLSWTTSIPSLAFLSWPITKEFGPIFSYNILMLLSPILAAQFAFLLIREICKKWFPAFIGGYIYGFSSYEFGQLLGHTNLSFIAIIPFIILIFIISIKNKWKPIKTASISGFLLAFEFYTSSEIYTSFFIFIILFFVTIFITLPELRNKIIINIKNMIYSYFISFILIMPAMIAMFSGKNPFSGGGAPSPEGFSTDLLNIIIPTPITYFGGNFFYYITKYFHGNYAEDDAYIGIIFIGIVIFIAARKKVICLLRHCSFSLQQ